LGCDHKFHPTLHTYTPLRDEWLQTSVEGCFVAGDAAEIIGKKGALIEGQLAGLAAAHQFGKLSESQALPTAHELRTTLKRECDYANLLVNAFAPLPGLWSMMKDDTIICRCEQITFGQVKQAAQDGMDSFAGVKNHTRAGMGWCQGRMCWMNAARIVSNELGIPLENASRHTVRPPIFPVTLGDMLEEESHVEVNK
jgi:NAD(P)H-nitrite reductase large subunit